MESLYRHLIKNPPPIPTILKWGMTFFIANIAWVFFRANNLDDAMYVFAHALDFSQGREQLFRPLFNSRFDVRLEFVLSFALIFGLFIFEFMNNRWQIADRIMQSPIIIRWSLYYAVVILVFLTLINVPSGQQFIYFQF